MKVVKGDYASPRWSTELLDCAMPMTLDTYSNCAFQCVYCFSFFTRAVGLTADDYLHHKVKSVDVERVKRMFQLKYPDESMWGQFNWYIRKGHVLQWGGLSDAFDWYERKLRKSLALLVFFRGKDYPISISTKGTWFLDDPEYVDAFRNAENVHIKYSIITTDPDKAKILEKGVPSPDERFKALKRLKEIGVGATTLRFRPFVLGVSDTCMNEMMARAAEAGVYSISTEFLCLENRVSTIAQQRYEIISQACGFDVHAFYKKHSKTSGYLRLNYEIKRPYMRRLQELCDKYGIKLFVSDAHHKEASHGAGCCGLPKDGPLGNYFKGQFSEAMQIAKEKGIVTWDDMSELAQPLQSFLWKKAKGFNQGTTHATAKRTYHTMYDFMRDMWNTPSSWRSPARYFGGVLVPGDRDSEGNLVYHYNTPLVDQGVHVKSLEELRRANAERFDEDNGCGTCGLA